jgi:hypothetical protein
MGWITLKNIEVFSPELPGGVFADWFSRRGWVPHRDVAVSSSASPGKWTLSAWTGSVFSHEGTEQGERWVQFEVVDGLFTLNAVRWDGYEHFDGWRTIRATNDVSLSIEDWAVMDCPIVSNGWVGTYRGVEKGPFRYFRIIDERTNSRVIPKFGLFAWWMEWMDSPFRLDIDCVDLYGKFFPPTKRSE